MCLTGACTQLYFKGQANEDYIFFEVFWFAYISSTTVGLGDIYFESAVFVGEDLIAFSFLFTVSNIILSIFFVKFAELMQTIFIGEGKLGIVESLVVRMKEQMKIRNEEKRKRMEKRIKKREEKKKKLAKTKKTPLELDEVEYRRKDLDEIEKMRKQLSPNWESGVVQREVETTDEYTSTCDGQRDSRPPKTKHE